MDKDKVNTEVKLSLLWNYGLSQLLKKNPPGNCSFTLHQVEIPMCVCVCVVQGSCQHPSNLGFLLRKEAVFFTEVHLARNHICKARRS